MGFFDKALRWGRNTYKGIKDFGKKAFKPVKTIVNGLNTGVDWIDEKLDELAEKNIVPKTIIGDIKNNPYYGEIVNTIKQGKNMVDDVETYSKILDNTVKGGLDMLENERQNSLRRNDDFAPDLGINMNTNPTNSMRNVSQSTAF